MQTLKTLSYTWLKSNLIDALDRVEKGETIEITRKGHKSILLTPNHSSEGKVGINKGLTKAL